MRKITPFLWFDSQAEEAAEYYVSLFEGSRITGVTRHTAEQTEVSGMEPGQVQTVSFELRGEPFIALNGGPVYQMTPATSFFVECGTQEELDKVWDGLTEGGEPLQCGWVTDRFGVTWQVVPEGIMEMINDPDQEKSDRVMLALFQMVKIDLATLQRAYEGV